MNNQIYYNLLLRKLGKSKVLPVDRIHQHHTYFLHPLFQHVCNPQTIHRLSNKYFY